jgi:phage gp45-like
MRFSSRTIGDRVHNAIKRVTVEDTNEDPLFRESTLSLYTEEKQKEIEHMEPYGFSSRVKKPTGEANNKKKAEGLMVFTGGNRSHGVLIVNGDRRYRLRGLKEGELALFDDQGQQVHFTRDGIVTSAPSGKKIVTQVMKSDKAPPPPQSSSSTSSAPSSGSSSGQTDSKKYGQSAQATQEVLTSLTLTKDSWVVNHPTKIELTVGNNTVLIDTGKIICKFGGDDNKSMRVDGSHTHIKFGVNSIFVDAGGCWSTVPIQLKADPQ